MEGAIWEVRTVLPLWEGSHGQRMGNVWPMSKQRKLQLRVSQLGVVVLTVRAEDWPVWQQLLTKGENASCTAWSTATRPTVLKSVLALRRPQIVLWVDGASGVPVLLAAVVETDQGHAL